MQKKFNSASEMKVWLSLLKN